MTTFERVRKKWAKLTNRPSLSREHDVAMNRLERGARDDLHSIQGEERGHRMDRGVTGMAEVVAQTEGILDGPQ